MKSDTFLSRLDAHRQAGRVDDDTFQRIADHEAKHPSPSPQTFGGITDDVGEDQGGSVPFLEHGKRFSLAVVAAIGATLVLVGVGLLGSLINDMFEIDAIGILFGLLAVVAWIGPRMDLDGRAGVFVGEARSILFGVSALIAVLWFFWEVVDLSWEDTFGPANIFEWGPLLGVAVASVLFARRMDAWVSYCASWILWFWPVIAAVDQLSENGAAVSHFAVMGTLAFVLWREWSDEHRTASSSIQATFLSMMLGIMAWWSLEVFSDVLDNDLVVPLLYVAGWMAWMEWFRRNKSDQYYPNGVSKSWPALLGVAVFYTGVPLYTGFALAEESGIEDIALAGFDLSLGFVYGLAFHALMGLQMFNWVPQDVVVKPSLSHPGTFSGSVFFVMAFIWFLFAAVDFLEDLAGYVFLPLGLLVLLIGTKRLIGSSEPLSQDRDVA